ncbi:MAG: HAMP domain-containing sensor histidine kinase [Acidimicrobiia bacterium]
MPAGEVYRRPLSFNCHRATAVVAAESRGHTNPVEAARAIAGAIAAVTGASSVAIVAGGAVIAVHRDGHDLTPLSPSASAAIQSDPSHTVTVPLPADALPRPASLVVVGADPASDHETLAEIAALGIDMAAMAGAIQRTSRSAALKDEFVAHVSHELRAPLTTIVGALQTLERLDPADPKTDSLQISVREGASRLRHLVEDLLVATKINGGGVPTRPQLTDVVEVVRHAVADVPGAAEVDVRALGSIPKVDTDEDHLRRIVTNLVDNAVRHGSGPAAVVIEASGSGVLVKVTDHGPGLPPIVALDPFSGNHRSDTGLGLGLRIAGGLASAVGAKLSHRATPGGGAMFVLELPAEADS